MLNMILYSLLGIVIILILLFQVVIPFFYLRYIKKMSNEKCGCSKTFSRHFLTFYAIYIYVAIVLLIICMANIPLKTLRAQARNETKLVINAGFSFLIAYYLYTYSKQMVDDQCECAKSWEIKVMKYHSYLQFVLVFITCMSILAILIR